jgi:hypothetical protein
MIKKETQLQRVIRRSESGDIGYGDVTIRISRYGFSMTRFCSANKFKQTMKEMTEAFLIVKKFKNLKKSEESQL